MQHNRSCVSGGSVANEAETSDLFQREPEGAKWERWRKGDTLHQITQLFNLNHSSVKGILVQTGGIQPAPRCRSRLALTLAEREEISRSS
jgi:hypothetical protein